MSTFNEIFFDLTEKVEKDKSITVEEAIKMFRKQCSMSETEAKEYVYGHFVDEYGDRKKDIDCFGDTIDP
jgi:hypothetical protein